MTTTSTNQQLLLPGFIDCHVHFREPGLEHKATIASEAAAARSGGIFVCCEMPNTNPGTNTVANLADKVRRADAVRHLCDVRFFFGATTLEHVKELENLFTLPENERLRKNCSGLKLYLDNSTGNMKSSDEVNEAAFALCGKLNIQLVAHCEHAATNDEAAESIPYTGVASHSQRRPAKSEVTSIGEAIALAKTFNTPLHIAHLSTSGGLQLVRQAKKDGIKITCEVTPHHLLLSTDDYAVLDGRGKVNPPLRAISERNALWEGVIDGTVDCLATDHAPHLLSEKDVKTGQPPSGLPAVEVSVALMLSIALNHWPRPPTSPKREHQTDVPKALLNFKETTNPKNTNEKVTVPDYDNLRFNVEDMVRLMFTNPNKIFSLNVDPKPRLVVNTDEDREIRLEDQVTKCKWTPYDGWIVKGTMKELNPVQE